VAGGGGHLVCALLYASGSTAAVQQQEQQLVVRLDLLPLQTLLIGQEVWDTGVGRRGQCTGSAHTSTCRKPRKPSADALLHCFSMQSSQHMFDVTVAPESLVYSRYGSSVSTCGKQ
jgi:hypothetical protein